MSAGPGVKHKQRQAATSISTPITDGQNREVGEEEQNAAFVRAIALK